MALSIGDTDPYACKFFLFFCYLFILALLMFGPSRLPEFSSFPLVYPLWFFPEKKRNACGFAIALISRRKFCTRTHNFLSLAMVAIVDVEVASDGCLNFSPVRAKEASCRPVPTLWPASCTARTSTTRRAAVPTAETTKISARTPVWKTTSSISAIRWITFFFFFFFFFSLKNPSCPEFSLLYLPEWL